MLVATVQSGSLDTLAPMTEGSLDLGKLDVAVGIATPATSYDDVIGALGLDAATAASIGAHDDLASRFASPDVDGNGKLDALEGADYSLDVHGDFDLGIKLADLMTTTPPAFGFSYQGTGLQVRMPKSFQMSGMTEAAIMFEDPFYGISAGAATPMVPAGTPIGSPELRVGALDAHPIAAVYARADREMPQGTYSFTARQTVLHFDAVRTPGAAELASGEGFIVPFLRVVPTGTRIASIEYRWMQRSGGSWAPASEAELSLMQAGEIEVSRLAPNGTAQVFRLTLPTTSSNGLIDWMSASHDGMLQSDLAEVAPSQITNVATSFNDCVGMRLSTSASNH